VAPTQQYPKVSERAWRKLRAKSAAAPSTKFTPAVVATALGMADPKSALSNVIAGMRRLGIFDDDGTLTARGNKWRVDASYAAACDEILNEVYPAELAGFTTGDGSPDAAAIKTWFQHQGFGDSNAGNMANTYAFVASRMVPEAPTAEGRAAPTKKAATAKSTQRRQTRSTRPDSGGENEQDGDKPEDSGRGRDDSGRGPSVHLDIQIHIPADATAEQVDTIFASMAKHLYGR
jgi:hypothetical protein